MELLEGQTLEERLVRGPLPMPEVLRIATELADALDHAHRRGLIHRDLKPGNVMLTKTGAGDALSIRERYPLAAFRSPKEALARITADVESVCEARRIATLVARAEVPVAVYSLDRRTLFDFIGDGWHQLQAGDYLAITSHGDLSVQAPCDLWAPLFLASVAGSVPASMP